MLYLLDGDHAFAMATDIVQYLIYGGHIPDLIIISPAYGIKNTPEYGGTNMRDRDLLPFPLQGINTPPGGAAYLTFIEHELMPFVAATYRIDTSDLTLAGYSFGSLFVLYSLFEKPGLFKRLIAGDGIDDQILIMEENFSSTHSALPVRLFFASASDDMSPFAARLEQRGYAGLTIEHVRLSSTDHFAAPAESLTRGLFSVYR